MKIAFSILLAVTFQLPILLSQSAFRPSIPRTWDEAALADWPTPLAGINARPSHISAQEYYSLTVENLRTYPVYYPGREPAGYWEMLQHLGPQPLIEAANLKNKADWIEAGRRVFEEADQLHERTYDPKLIAAARQVNTFTQAGAEPLPDGTLFFLRWVPTTQGAALSLGNCSICHLQYRPDGTRIPGAPTFAELPRPPRLINTLVSQIHAASHVLSGDPPLKETHVPGGWAPPGTKTRAIRGHEFGLQLSPTEREPLIAIFADSLTLRRGYLEMIAAWR